MAAGGYYKGADKYATKAALLAGTPSFPGPFSMPNTVGCRGGPGEGGGSQLRRLRLRRRRQHGQHLRHGAGVDPVGSRSGEGGGAAVGPGDPAGGVSELLSDGRPDQVYGWCSIGFGDTWQTAAQT